MEKIVVACPQRNSHLQSEAVSIVHQLRKNGNKAYLCGGCVRDLLLDRKPKDYDIVTDATPDEVKKIFRRTIDVGVQFGVVKVLIKKNCFEVATFRSDGEYQDGRRPKNISFSSEKEDALRRDFTINGMFLDPETNTIIDYVGGIKDLKENLIRTIGIAKERFEEDHLRLLRAIRFACQLDFSIEKKNLGEHRRDGGFHSKNFPRKDSGRNRKDAYWT